jgi:hypothetical protein
MTLYDGIKWTIRKWNQFAQPRMMPVKGKGRKTVAYGLAGVIFGVPFLFANPNSTIADVYLQLQLPDGYTQMGTIGGTATDIATGQVAMVGVPNIDAGRIDFYNLNTPVKERGSDLPSKYDLSQNNPNPFNPTTNMQYNLPKPENVRIDILNSLGQRVKTLVDENVGAGMHDVRWDGTDDFGRGVSAGLYFARMSAGDYTEVIKMIKSDGTISGGGIFAPMLAKAAGVNDSGVEYRFDVYDTNIDSTSLTQRIVNDTTMVVPVQGKINVNPWSFIFNEADSAQIDLSKKISAAFGVNSYSIDNPSSNLIVDVNGNYLKVEGRDGDVNGSFLSDLIVRDNHGTEKRIQIPTAINPMTDIPMRTFDVQYLKERMAGTIGGIPGSVMIDGKIYKTDAKGLLNVQVSPRDSIEVKVSTTKDNNPDSFASLFWVPVKADYSKMLNVPVVSYKGMSYDTPIPISPETMKGFAAEGVFNPQNGADYPGLKGFDWTRKYNEWIDAGQWEIEIPLLYKTYTPQQQQQVAQFIRQLQHPSFVDSAYVPEIEIASAQDTLPAFRTQEGFARPQRGYFHIVPRKIAPQMGFGGWDYDSDGVMDAGEIYITYLDNPYSMETEFKSKFVLSPINSDSMRGKTRFHQKERYPVEDSVHNTRLMNITQLMHTEPFAIRERGGELYLGFKPKTDIDRILSIP